MKKQKLLLDTDIGCDYDDCLALTYLLHMDSVELMGVTTCTGSPHRRAMLVEIVCNAHNKEIPVYVGAENPMIHPIVQWGIVPTESEVMDTYPHKDFQNKNQAIEFMRKVIEANPHEVVLACIGPLTNAALLFSAYPHLPELLDGMIIMGGRFGECDSYWGEIEWNIRCDYHAAAIVFRQNVKNCMVAGVELTSRYAKESDILVREFLKQEKHIPIAKALPVENQKVWFHDVVALAAYLDGEGASYSRGDIEVLLNDMDKPGETVFTPDENGRHILVTDYDEELFFQKYSDVVGINMK